MNSTSPVDIANLIPVPVSVIAKDTAPAKGACRFCGLALKHSFVDLGKSPLSENFLPREELTEMEPFFPLHAFVCEKCFLVQVEEYVDGKKIFGGDYAYFSSYSTSWMDHARRYVDMITEKLSLDGRSLVIEIASNDGYLLRNFVDKQIPALGIEPAKNVAAAAREVGVNTIDRFFGTSLADELGQDGAEADLLIANNVMAHVPNLNDFVRGMKRILKPNGVITVEFPHVLTQMQGNQFDTIYQEHYCYFSLLTVQKVFAAHGLRVFDLDHLKTHGGSLRVYGAHESCERWPTQDAVDLHLHSELEYGLDRLETYSQFAERTVNIKHRFLEFLIQARREGKRVAGYGAPGKGNTFLNYCGIRSDMIEFVVDRNTYKHGKYLPGTHIPVRPETALAEARPDVIVILPWNLKQEISKQLAYTADWNAQLAVAIPELEVFAPGAGL